MIGVFQLYFVPRPVNETTVYKSIVPCLEDPAENRISDVVDITVIDDEEQAQI
jgi:hypothetical protein